MIAGAGAVSDDTRKNASVRQAVAKAAEASFCHDDEQAFRPMTAEEARQWRSLYPQVPLSRALLWEALTGLVVALAAWLLTQSAAVAWSAAYGAAAGVIPAAVAAVGTVRWARHGFPPGAALAGLLLWEGVKLVLTMGLLMAAPKFLGVPSWPALLISLVLTIKIYWVGLLWVRPLKSGRARKERTDGC